MSLARMHQLLQYPSGGLAVAFAYGDFVANLGIVLVADGSICHSENNIKAYNFPFNKAIWHYQYNLCGTLNSSPLQS